MAGATTSNFCHLQRCKVNVAKVILHCARMSVKCGIPDVPQSTQSASIGHADGAHVALSALSVGARFSLHNAELSREISGRSIRIGILDALE
jgi:hypothetical protein